MDGFVQAGTLTREQAKGCLEETMRIRIARLPHPHSHHVLEPDEVYAREKANTTMYNSMLEPHNTTEVC